MGLERNLAERHAIMAAKKKGRATRKQRTRPLPKPGYHLIFVRRFWHKRAKRYVYPKKGECFCFEVPDEPKT